MFYCFYRAKWNFLVEKFEFNETQFSDVIDNLCGAFYTESKLKQVMYKKVLAAL